MEPGLFPEIPEAQVAVRATWQGLQQGQGVVQEPSPALGGEASMQNMSFFQPQRQQLQAWAPTPTLWFTYVL